MRWNISSSSQQYICQKHYFCKSKTHDFEGFQTLPKSNPAFLSEPPK